MNNSVKDNLKILGDILKILNLCKREYSKTIWIITKQKSLFRKLFIDNPNLYFTDFKVQVSLSEKDVVDINKDSLKNIVVLDETTSNNELNNVHYIYTTSTFSLIKDSLVIHKIDNGTLRKFYDGIIKKITEVSYDTYNKCVNTIIGSRYIIIKNKQVYYN